MKQEICQIAQRQRTMEWVSRLTSEWMNSWMKNLEEERTEDRAWPTLGDASLRVAGGALFNILLLISAATVRGCQPSLLDSNTLWLWPWARDCHCSKTQRTGSPWQASHRIVGRLQWRNIHNAPSTVELKNSQPFEDLKILFPNMSSCDSCSFSLVYVGQKFPWVRKQRQIQCYFFLRSGIPGLDPWLLGLPSCAFLVGPVHASTCHLWRTLTHSPRLRSQAIFLPWHSEKNHVLCSKFTQMQGGFQVWNSYLLPQ